MTLLEIVQSACDRLSLARPAAVMSSTDRQVRQLAAIAREVGEDLSTRGDPGWTALQKEWTFVTVASEQQADGSVQSDLRNFVPGTFFNRTAQREVIGPLTPRQYQLMKARPTALSVYLTYRLPSVFLINPTPPAGQTIAYEYITKNWVLSSGGMGKSAFTTDEDTTLLDDELMILGLKWRYKQSKGLDYGEDMASFERAVMVALGNDAIGQDLDIGGGTQLPDYIANIPESGYGS